MVKLTPTLPSLGEEQLRILGGSIKDYPSSSSVVVAEGIPPLPLKTLEKIRKWEYVDLTALLSNDPPAGETFTITVYGQTLIVNSPDQTKKRKVALDIHSWTQAYSTYPAALTSAEDTTKSESTGLLAHMYNVLQLARDLGGNQWLQYDKAFGKWAAAKELRLWGELNLQIFCHCLATQQRMAVQPQESTKPSISPYTRSSGCRLWNFKVACTRWGCRFLHTCFYCEGPHKAPNCLTRAKKGQGYPIFCK